MVLNLISPTLPDSSRTQPLSSSSSQLRGEDHGLHQSLTMPPDTPTIGQSIAKPVLSHYTVTQRPPQRPLWGCGTTEMETLTCTHIWCILHMYLYMKLFTHPHPQTPTHPSLHTINQLIVLEHSYSEVFRSHYQPIHSDIPQQLPHWAKLQTYFPPSKHS